MVEYPFNPTALASTAIAKESLFCNAQYERNLIDFVQLCKHGKNDKVLVSKQPDTTLISHCLIQKATMYCIIGGSCRDTLVVAFDFLP